MPGVGFNNRVHPEFCACECVRRRGHGGKKGEAQELRNHGVRRIMYDASTICAAAPEIRLQESLNYEENGGRGGDKLRGNYALRSISYTPHFIDWPILDRARAD